MIGYYLRGRRFEWVVTISMLWLAGAMVISPQILHASAFQWVTLVMSPSFIDAILFGVGFTRLIGLLLNGHMILGHRAGPLVRGSMAIIGAVMWVQFDLALVQLSIQQGFMAPGVPFWSMLVLGELDVAYRAVAENEGSS